MNFGRYYHTLRHLRPIQFYGRLAHLLHRPRPDTRPAPPIRDASTRYCLPPLRVPSLLSSTRARFLNVERDIDTPACWNDAGTDKLWLYNLHYFDDLDAQDRERRARWHEVLILRWIEENPPAYGNGWEPYPLSLRTVNWIRWALAGNSLPPDAVHSLAIQARFLTKRLEYHLLGNHLWANGKALIFAGAFFAGNEAAEWLHAGLSIVQTQLGEQVLADGGHFERSPMYHSIVLQDLLDLLALARCYPGLVEPEPVDRWSQATRSMLRWLEVMSHPDGNIAFFNDAALGIAAPLGDLRLQARALSIESPPAPSSPLVRLDQSGYVRMKAGEFVLIADVAPVGPDYLPGHAHADTLSFELSWRGRRVFSNSGTSCYGDGTQRQIERSTAAHNTVTVDRQDSSEVWSGFRVARRARPFDLITQGHDGAPSVACSHDGFRRLPGSPVHRREWQLDRHGLQVVDTIVGTGVHEMTRYLHVHPGITLRRIDDRSVALEVPEAGRLTIRHETGGTVEVRDAFLAPEFGRILPRPVITSRSSGTLPLTTRFKLTH